MRELASLSLAQRPRLEGVQLNLLGDELFIGCCDISEGERWGVVPCTLDRLGEFLPSPSSELTPGIDGYAFTVAALRESLMVVFGEAPPYAPERTFFGVYDRALKDWRVFQRDAQWSPIALGYTRGSSHAISLNEAGAEPVFELIDLMGSRTVGRVPTRQREAPQSIAMNLALTHIAMAQQDTVVCARLDGEIERSWPKSERFNWLWFAGDDVVGASREGFVLHRRQGKVERFWLPNMRPRAFDAERKVAFFVDAKSRDFVEVDLATGQHLSAGKLPEGACFDVDLKTRRIAAFTHEQRLLRVYELPP